MNTSDLPVLPKSRRDTWDCVINEVEGSLVNALFWLYFIWNGMVDPLFHPIMDVLGLIDYS
jgi:hypothetical protein